MTVPWWSCHACGSRFHSHRCGAPGPAVCAFCGHLQSVHHRTESGRHTYCTVWATPVGQPAGARQCPCKGYRP